MKKVILSSLIVLLVVSGFVPAATTPAQADYVENQIIVKFSRPVTDTLDMRLSEGISESGLKLSRSLDMLNKKYRLKKAKPLFKNFRKNRQHIKTLLKKDKTLLTKKEKHILTRLSRAPRGAKVPELDRIYKIDLDLEEGQSLEDVVAAYNNDPDVEYAELNYIVSICKTPNDPLYSLQWPLNNTGQMYPESGRYNSPPGTTDCDIDAPQAWDIYTGSSEVVVAVIDTGVDYTHRDIDDNMWLNPDEIPGNGLDDDGNGYIDDIYGYDFRNDDSDPTDDHGHGTHCAGIIAAEGDNVLDIAGLCWDAKIMALKFLDSGGSGGTSDAVNAFYYAVENGADVTSNSWGGGNYSQSAQDAIDYAYSQGVIMVAAAGNNGSSLPHYPAYYDHMISVAATNSNDQKASFSNYGDWVDIAAPGVDVLSLRAAGTSMGTTYDSYTTIASGTSMACPHVAGACAFLLLNPFLTSDEVLNILTETADSITPGICISGRLNAHRAVTNILGPLGRICLDLDFYSCSSLVGIVLFDSDLKGNGSQIVTVTTDGSDYETLLLTESDTTLGTFGGVLSVESGPAKTEDGILQISHDQIITATYEDANDGTGSTTTVEDIATVDCEGPVISDVQVGLPGAKPKVTFETDEVATIRILCGLECGGDYIIEDSNWILAISHALKLVGVLPETDYYFIIEATDRAGNVTVDDNGGGCYTFTTTGPGDIHVPSQAETIQEAIDNSWDGGTVHVADGIYTGQGNRDIDFLGKAITVKSENGPENCIIDCQAAWYEPHRGFYFHSGEGIDTVVDGLTIINGYASYGGGIYCSYSSPTITKCVIKDNTTRDWSDGGGIYCTHSNVTITKCIVNNNKTKGDGGGISCWWYSTPIIRDCNICNNYAGGGGGGISSFRSEPQITDCTINNNVATYGAGIFGHHDEESPTISNCIISGNASDYNAGGGIQGCNGPITNCVITGNTGVYAGGGGLNRCNGPITNCIITNNTVSNGDGGGVYRCNGPVTSCIIAGNSASDDGGGIDITACTSTITNCTIANNTAGGSGGGIYGWFDSNVTIRNCILWNNSGYEIFLDYDRYRTCTLTVHHSDVQGGLSSTHIESSGTLNWGIGNIDHDPCFADPGFWDGDLWINGDYHLLPESPCIDAGDPNHPNDPNETDIDGQPRIIHWRVDIGADEYDGNNAAPVADAGEDQVAFAWINGIAEVILDGTGSYDDDGHRLAYLWTWIIDGNNFTATGPNPVVELPVGEHIIELTVNDRVEDSEPDEVKITVIEPIQARLWLFPQTINRQSRLEKVMAWMKLPEGITKDQIDQDSPLLLYPGPLEPINQYIFEHGQKDQKQTNIFILYDKAELLAVVPDNGLVDIQVIGSLTTGQQFYGTGFVSILDRRQPHQWRLLKNQ